MDRKNGFSLVSVLVAIGLAGVLSMLLSQMWRNNQQMLNKTQMETEIMDLHRLVTQRLNCAGHTCEDLAAAISKDRIGAWGFKPSCQGADLYIQTRKYGRDNVTPASDPIHRRPMDWQPLGRIANGLFCRAQSTEDEMQGLCPKGQKVKTINPSDLSVVCE